MRTDKKELTKEEIEYLKKVGIFCFTEKELKFFYELTGLTLRVANIFDNELLNGYGEITQMLKKETGVSLRDFIRCCEVLNDIYNEQVKKMENDPFK